jgi:hypothetical protein
MSTESKNDPNLSLADWIDQRLGKGLLCDYDKEDALIELRNELRKKEKISLRLID